MEMTVDDYDSETRDSEGRVDKSTSRQWSVDFEDRLVPLVSTIVDLNGRKIEFTSDSSKKIYFQDSITN